MLKAMLLACALTCAATACAATTAHAQPVPAQDQRVVFVMIDGLRWQEVFRGADPALAAEGEYMHSEWASTARAQFAEASDRRAALMPFVTGTMATQGALIGIKFHKQAQGHTFAHSRFVQHHQPFEQNDIWAIVLRHKLIKTL